MNSSDKKTSFATARDKTRIYYEVYGQGKPIIFLYGMACQIDHFQKQIPFLKRDHRLIFMDYRGHHKSELPKNPDNITMDHVITDIRAVMREEKIKKAVFVGHSFGSHVMFAAYKKHPAMFKAMIHICGYAGNPLKTLFGNERFDSIFEIIKLAHTLFPDKSDRIWKKFFTNPLSPVLTMFVGFNPLFTDKHFVNFYLKGVAKISVDVFTKMMDSGRHNDMYDVLPGINVPTLVIAGSKDLVVPVKTQKKLAEQIPGAELQMVPMGSHCAHVDMPDLVNLKITDFLAELGI